MPKRTFFTYLAEFIVTFVFVAILVALFMSLLPGCRSVRNHKDTSTQQLDSLHLVSQHSQAGIHQDSSAHQGTLDSGGRHSTWNYERETTITQDWFAPHGGPDSPQLHLVARPATVSWTPGTWTAGAQPVMRSTTTVREKGNQETMETHLNRSGLDVDWSKVDTSTQQATVQDQVHRAATRTVQDRTVKSLPWWLVPLAVLLALGAITIELKAGQWSWILALFRRKSRQDNS